LLPMAASRKTPRRNARWHGGICRRNCVEIENQVKITAIVRDPADVAKVRAGRAAVLSTHRASGALTSAA
jgi:hypothetical protein